MNRFYYIVIFFLSLITFVTLAPSAARAQTDFFPTGVHDPAKNVRGIYAGTDRGNCCWLGSKGTITATAPHGADTLLLNVLVPDYAVSGNGQALRVQINADRPQVRCCFGAGEHEFAFRLPADVARHPQITIHLSARSTFVPKDLGLNQDPRHLSVLIRGLRYFDSRTAQIVGESGAGLQEGPWVWLAACGIVVLLLTLRRPIFGAAALMLSNPFLLAHSVHGTTVTLPKIALIAVAIGLLPHLRRLRLGESRALQVLLGAQILFVASMALSSVHAAYHAAALRETLKALEYAAALAVVYIAYRIDPDELVIRYALCISAALVSALALAQEYSGAPQSELIAGHTVARIAGPLEGPNQLSGYLGLVVPAMLAFAVRRPAFWLERLAIGLGCAACVLTFSRAGIGALALAIAVILFLRYRPAWNAALGTAMTSLFFMGLAVAFGVFTGLLHGRAASLFGPISGDAFNGGLGSRTELWHGAFLLWRSSPLLGIGPGNFEHAIGRFDPGVYTHANGMYFQVLAEQGIAGLAAMFAVIAASIWTFVRRLDQPLALGACAAGVALMFHQIVDCMWIYPKVGLMWWLLLALGAAAVDLRTVSERVTKAAVA